MRLTATRLLACVLIVAVACGDDDGGAPDAADDVSADVAADVLSDALDSGVDAGPGECGDGIDNDGDGYVDWQFDQGCYGPADRTEGTLPRDQEDGWTTFDIPSDSVAIYVSNDGDDTSDGLSPESAVATVAHAATLVRDGEHDFILLRRGDTFRDQVLRRFKSGRDAEHPMVIGSYGDSLERPRVENAMSHFIDHNGRSRSFLSVVGIHFSDYSMYPDDPAYDGSSTSALRLVGGGQDLLIEGCHFQHTPIVVQSFADERYVGVEFRRNVVERAFGAGSCVPGDPNGNHEIRPQGIFTGGVSNLMFEENVFDHNGWSPDLDETACATIFNHNLYLSNSNGLIIRNNIIARASSIGVKLTANDGPASTRDVLIEGNFFTEGEIGISIGGNAEGPYRFLNTRIVGNVFSDIGRTLPTTRGLAWGIGVIGNDQTVIEDNLILNNRSPDFSNMYGINVGGIRTREVSINNNVFFRLKSQALRLGAAEAGDNLSFARNDIVDPEFSSCLVSARNGLAGYRFSRNRYFSSAVMDQWFCVGDSGRVAFDGWVGASGETGSTLTEVPYSDPDRSVESYAQTLGFEGSLEAFLEEARGQSRMRWRSELTTEQLVAYIRAGFDR